MSKMRPTSDPCPERVVDSVSEAAAPHFPWLDWLRFLAALTVVLVHARGAAFVEFGSLPETQKSAVVAAVFAFTRLGNEAVIVFFVLSGFLVGGKAYERIAAGTFRPVDYAIDRFARIMLPLVPALVLTAGVAAFIGLGVNPWTLLGNLFSMQGVLVPSFGGNGPLWSLSYEVWFYVLAGAVGVFVMNRRLSGPATIVIVFVCMIFTRLDEMYLFCWLLGGLAFLQRPRKASLTRLLGAAMISGLGTVGVQLAKTSISLPISELNAFVPPLSISTILIGAGVALGVQQLILLKPRAPRVIRVERFGAKLAAFSYTLYLTHYPILRAMSYLGVERAQRISVQSTAIYAAMVIACLVCGWLLYWPFERRTSEARTLLKALLLGKTAPSSSN